MSGTRGEAAVTPGQALWESLRETALREFGDDSDRVFETWDELPAVRRERLEAAAQRAIEAAQWPRNLDLRDRVDYLAGQMESNASRHSGLSPERQAESARFAADLRALLKATREPAAIAAQPQSPDASVLRNYLDDFTHAVIDFSSDPKIIAAARALRKKTGMEPF